jgi:hypothetical protein
MKGIMTRPLVIFGTGAHARKAFHCWTQAGGVVSAFADENVETASPVAGVPVLAAAELELQATPGQLFVGVGRADERQRLMDHHEQRGWQLPALVHPRASVAPDAVLAAGVIVAAGAVVESGSHIGRGAIVDVGVIVDHDCRIAEYSHLRPGQVCLPATRWPA